MANTAPQRLASLSASSPIVSRQSADSLVDQIVRLIESRIDDKLLRSGARLPSIRQFAASHQVSRFTVVEAYDRLVARGLLESRRGSGFYVRESTPSGAARAARTSEDATSCRIDVAWLLRNMFRQHPPQKMPGSGLLPREWLDAELVSGALRAVGRQPQEVLLNYGTPQGFLPLRQQLQFRLAAMDVGASPEQIVTTSGITQALDLIARHFMRPGDAVFVDDPGWFHMFGMFASMGMKIVGIPRLPDGPDIARLTELAELHKPRLYIINSVLHNPTSTSLTAAKAFQVLKLAEQHDFTIVEDDIYTDMHAGQAVRIAALDQLNRVIYLGSFSKTLAANLRVGFIAASPELADRLTEQKMLSTLTTSEIGERMVYKILSEGHYRKHADRLRGRIGAARDKALRQLERSGARIDVPPSGVFLWLDTGRDTNLLAAKAMEQDYLFAPGSLFSPSQLPSTRTRLNVTTMSDPGVLRLLAAHLDGS